MKPGMAVESWASTSCAPAGSSRSAREPINSTSPSRIRMPASAISPLGVTALPTCRSVVVMASLYRSGFREDGKPYGRRGRKLDGNKNQAGGSFDPPAVKNTMNRRLHVLFGRHVDARKLNRVAAGRTLDSHMMSRVSRDFVLIVDGVDLLVRVVDEHIFGAMFLDTLGGAFAGFGVGALDAALAVGNPASPAAIGGHGHSCGKQRRCANGCKSKFHLSPSRKLLCPMSRSGFASGLVWGPETLNPV